MSTEQAPALPDSEEFRKALAAELRALLARKKVTQRVVAQRFGWRENAVSKRLNGAGWDVRDLMALCYMLGTDIGTVTEAARQAAAAEADGEDDAAAL